MALSLGVQWTIGRMESTGRFTLKIELPAAGERTLDLTDDQRFDLLKLESELLQTRFDKYDGLIFQLRGWLMTIILAAAGAYVTLPDHPRLILFVALAVVFSFWRIEYHWRTDWTKYVHRYKFIREALHRNIGLAQISPLDLTDHYRRIARKALYVEKYGESVGNLIEKEYRTSDEGMPMRTSSEMLIFYVISIVGILLLIAFPMSG